MSTTQEQEVTKDTWLVASAMFGAFVALVGAYYSGNAILGIGMGVASTVLVSAWANRKYEVNE